MVEGGGGQGVLYKDLQTEQKKELCIERKEAMAAM